MWESRPSHWAVIATHVNDLAEEEQETENNVARRPQRGEHHTRSDTTDSVTAGREFKGVPGGVSFPCPLREPVLHTQTGKGCWRNEKNLAF